MARVYIGVGSNIDRAQNIRSAVRELREVFSAVIVSPVYESEPVGFTGDRFFNLVVAGDTEWSAYRVADRLSEIEMRHGRVRNSARFSARTLDLDLLQYDALILQDERLSLPRDEITEYAFVLCPLAQIAPIERHPLLGQTYAELWQAFTHDEQKLWTVEFAW